MNTAGAVVLAIVLLLLTVGIGWVIFTRVRASQLGVRVVSSGWFSDTFHLNGPGGGCNARTAPGAFEGPKSSGPGLYNAAYVNGGGSGGGIGSRKGYDPWDSRVGGYNPYEEERELGLVPPGGGSGGGEGYAMNLAVAPGGSTGVPAVGGGDGGGGEEERRGRPRSRSPGPGQGQGVGAAAAVRDPFGDGAEPSNLSLRGVSPRPMDDGASFAARKAAKREEDRRSMFREEV
ncbi:predicted protein [Chaetomium globosum CBS 148.51]|uniref:Uncharacterized protein n=1 Tax=Chaetomium globosum (strain ATCC 6205 / CBS 148.51 / DSM 1962 / NBRC 6347 / NRRL 1970) TaxID=306901 RepID=Q2H2W7_CHAGB|nr:uncharacterized protein CHGG_03879 [Chaetomium globosum CBS 148.51]EAQ87260.1 predicted protein [Chaetomium globosum CBS 148.51]